MSDRLERACQECGSLLHHEDDCPRKLDVVDVVQKWRRRMLQVRAATDTQPCILELCDRGDALAAELAAYRSAFGPLVVGAQPVKCLGCYAKTARIQELEDEVRRRDGRQVDD